MTDINITHQKQAFLTSQVHLLNTPLTTPATSFSTTTISATTIDSIVAKLNKQITSHNRLVFGLQSQRHVAEQIDALYWQDVLRVGLPVQYPDVDGDKHNGTTVVKRDVTLTTLRDIDRNLTEEWADTCLRPSKRRRTNIGEDTGRERSDTNDTEGTDGATSEQEQEQNSRGRQYTSLRVTLLDQARRRDELKAKIARCKKVQELLRPLENAKENVQPNLVTRDNEEIEAEVARMRVLLARAGNAVQAMSMNVRMDNKEVMLSTPDERLENLLGLG